MQDYNNVIPESTSSCLLKSVYPETKLKVDQLEHYSTAKSVVFLDALEPVPSVTIKPDIPF